MNNHLNNRQNNNDSVGKQLKNTRRICARQVHFVLYDKLREPEKCLIVLADFDGVTYRLSTPDSKTILIISVGLKCYGELLPFGAKALMSREYGSALQESPEPGYDVSLKYDLEHLPSDKESLIKALSLLKRNILAAPFELAFASQQSGNPSETMALHYREGEAMYVKALSDRVTVIFATEFKDETDRIFGKVFLQEFVDARRQAALQNAPQVLYSKDPPMEVRGHPGLIESESIGYVTFVLFPRHYQGSNAAETISRIQLFRDYLHYHIKASKAYMHSRMRARVDTFMKVLNRAKPEKIEDKKTSSGKTFKRS